MCEQELRDFMNVDSFSQLPFIRPSPKPSITSPNSAVRLFGFDFPPDPHSSESEQASTETSASANDAAITPSGGETGRRFECHYCCRSFPTSQALGGHQNAHKRERQLAKRAHLQAAMAAAQRHHIPIVESHVYGILNYHRLGSSPFAQQAAAAARIRLEHPTCPLPHYPSWSGEGGGTQFCGGLGSVSQPINGNPLPGLWRAPNGVMGIVVHGDPTIPIALSPLARDPGSKLKPQTVAISPTNGGGGGGGGSSSPSSALSSVSAPASHLHDVREWESGARDHSVSLDLHL